MKIFSILGKVLGKFGVILFAIFSIFDFETLLETGDIREWVRLEFKKLADVFKEKFGKGKIKVTQENATLFIESAIMVVQKFGSVAAFHSFISQVSAEHDDEKLSQIEREVSME